MDPDGLARDLVPALAGVDGRCELTFVSSGPHPDSALLYHVARAGAAPFAALLCSKDACPQGVRLAMDRTAEAALALDPTTRARVLTPSSVRSTQGLSYAIFPLCLPLAVGRFGSRLQAPLVQRALFGWLADVAHASRAQADPRQVLEHFASPLDALSRASGTPARVRRCLDAARRRLDAGWQPLHTLMHGDLWRGNVMLLPRHEHDTGLAGRLVVIDWGGSRCSGYPFVDLLRFARSMRTGRRTLRRQLALHADALDCGLEDVPHYVVSALAMLFTTLEYFPAARFFEMCDKTLDQLEALELA